jgi:hypothetical protein
MNKAPLLLTRENLLSYCKETTEELAHAREKRNKLKELLKTDLLPNRYWSVLIKIHKLEEIIKDIKNSLLYYHEQLEILSIG